jgi:hypothetical protein
LAPRRSLAAWFRRLVRGLAKLLAVGVPGALVGLLQFLVLALLLPVVLLLLLIEWLMKLSQLTNLYPERTEEPCPQLPESVTRRPDPCIYSQILLHSQGLPFTYNNPDIWITDPADPSRVVTELEPNTEYLINVRVHNASIDPAIGVRVGMGHIGRARADRYEPVERDPLGAERFQYVDVAGLSSTVTQFKGPVLVVRDHDPGERDVLILRLQARISHPADANLFNNVGQHDITFVLTNPGHVLAGERFQFSIPLANPLPHATRFAFETNVYEVDFEQKATLRVRFARGRARWSLSRRLYNVRPTLYYREPIRRQRQTAGRARDRSLRRSLTLLRRSRLQVVKARYEGFDAIREQLLSRDWSLPPGYSAGPIDPADLDFEAGQERVIRFEVQVPGDAAPGSELTLNFVARSAAGDLVSGFSLPLRVAGEVE